MRALVLSGGGSKCISQLGVLRELLNNEPNLDYSLYSGTSGGAMNAAFLATGKLKDTLPKLEDLWLDKVKNNQSVRLPHLWAYIVMGLAVVLFFTIAAFISFIIGTSKLITILFGVLAVLSLYVPYYSLNHTHFIYDNNPLKKLISENLNTNALKNSGKKLRIGAVSFSTGEYISVTEQDDDIIDWIMASSAYPIFFPMQKIRGQYWWDGGVTDNCPIDDVIELGATEIDIILTSPTNPKKRESMPSIPGQLSRLMELLWMQKIHYSHFRQVKQIRIFAPDKYFSSNILSFNKNKLVEIYEEGKKIAERVLNK